MGKHCPLDRAQLHLESGHNRLRNVVLDLKNIVEVAIVTFGPDVGRRTRVNQLRVDSDPTAGLAHRPFEHEGDAKLASDLDDVR